MKRREKSISFILLIAIYLGTFSPFVLQANAQRVTGRAMPTNMNISQENGLKFRLSEGVEGAQERAVSPPTKGDPLAENETANLLKRLPPVKAEPDDQADFAKRVGSLPAPKTGKMIPVKFPSDDQRGTPKIETGKNLEVLRFSPEGEINLAPDLNVTFSQPMVAVTSQEQAAETVPVQLTPQPEGKWRWLGTKTLMFDATKRLPMATRFTARVPAGTKSANGEILQKDVVWTFTTPPPAVETKFPENTVTRRDALMFISFDQEINPEAVIKTISVTAAGRKIPVRLATQEEIEKDASVSYYSKQAQPKRWIAFRAINSDGLTENALPADAAIQVTVEQGTPSAEGPLTTAKAQGFGFRTFGAMKLVGSWCNYQSSKTCTPFDTWYLQFSNPIDATNFTKEMVKIEPAIENANIYPSGQYIYIQGYKKGRTNYKVTVDQRLKDTFEQNLSAPATATFNVGSAQPNLYAQGGSFVTLDPTSKPVYSIYSTNHNSVKLQVYSVTPENWEAFRAFMRHLNYDEQKRPPMPGKLVVDKTLKIENKPDELVEMRIDLSPVLKAGIGHAIVYVEPTVKRDKYDRTKIVAWTQATQIGLDAFVDNQELVGFATELRTGKPLASADLSIYPNGKTLSQQQTKNSEQLTASKSQTWWEWLTSWGSSDDSIKETQIVSEGGAIEKTETISEAQTNRTGENGILRLPLPDTQSRDRQNVLIARKGNDVALLPEQSDYYWQQAGSWYKKPNIDHLRWFVFDDRKMYRPKEEVSVKGYIRVYKGGKFGDVEALADAASGISYIVRDPRGNEIAKGNMNLNVFGGFDFKFKLPDNANLGQANIQITTNAKIPGGTTHHYFQVQEFRRPEFEVTAKNETEAPYFVKSSAMVSVNANYYAGGGLANAEANWTVTSTPTNYTPPKRDDFTFGIWIPWWRGHVENYGATTSQSFKGITDAAGKHLLKIDFENANPPRPYSVRAQASVQDVNRQTWSSATNLLVHPSELYVGIRTPRTFVNKGEKISIESITTDIDGNAAANRDVTVTAILKDWRFDKGQWKQETIDEQKCVVKSTANAVKCEFTAKNGGVYTIRASVFDDRERENQSELTIWVPGGKQPPKRTVEQEEAQLIPDKKDYAPGDVAEILVQSPFVPAEGVLTLRRDGIVKTERFTMKESSTILKIPLEERYLPNIHAQVDLVGNAPRTDDAGEIDPKLAPRPAFAKGSLNLAISTASRKLTVSAEPQAKTLEPAGETKIDVIVKDYRGEPVSNSEVAVVVVDESVLALSGYRIGNPLDLFYTQRGAGTIDYHSRKDVILGNAKDIQQIENLQLVGRGVSKAVSVSGADIAGAPPPPSAKPMARQAMKSEMRADAAVVDGQEVTNFKTGELNEDGTPINLRTNFNALAVFAPNIKTDSNGRAVIPVKLPDNLTRYRIMAVSVDAAKRFGGGESNITAKQPLMVRPSASRFMNFGDKMELPVVVQNQTENPMTVNVAVRATNAELTGGGGKRVVVPANDRVEVRFPVSAVKAGTARFQIGVNSGKYSDAAEISLPVWTPATTEAFATYGTTDQSGAIVQPIEAPKDVYSQFGGLEVTTSSTQLQELTDAFIYLYRYPYECSEQVASRMISISALRDVLTAFKAKDMPTKAELDASFAKDIEILKSRQREDGSFGLWGRQRERYEYPFLTVHVAHALTLAKSKGYKVPDDVLNKTKPYLKNIESKFDDWHRKSPQARWTVSAYALYIRDLMGDKDAAKAKALLKEATLEKLPFEAIGWILSVLADDKNSVAEVDAIKRFLMNRTTETAAAANFVTNYGDGAWLVMYSNRRADGVLLEALIKAEPNNDLIPKLVRGLLAHRKQGHWGSTQENVFILLALDKYFNAFEKVTPDYVSRVWLGNAYAGEQIFKGRSVDSNLINIPMSYLIEQNGAANLILDKQGAGRLYYRIGMKYAPKNLRLAPADYGFTVLRQYEAVDNAEDVKQNADGSWTFKSGSRVRVRLTMINSARRYHVALVDPLPAGLEILNPELAVTEGVPADKGGGNTSVIEMGSRSMGRNYWYWRWTWFEHQNFRDERAEAFSSLLWEGVYRYTYVTRATTPGEFVVPPAKAEEMYHPETFGRTGTDFVKVE
jgi:alpha-2-macroglobulin